MTTAKSKKTANGGSDAAQQFQLGMDAVNRADETFHDKKNDDNVDIVIGNLLTAIGHFSNVLSDLTHR